MIIKSEIFEQGLVHSRRSKNVRFSPYTKQASLPNLNSAAPPSATKEGNFKLFHRSQFMNKTNVCSEITLSYHFSTIWGYLKNRNMDVDILHPRENGPQRLYLTPRPFTFPTFSRTLS